MATNLDAEQPGPGQTKPPVRTQEPEVVKSSKDGQTRQWISYFLLMMLAAIILAAFWQLFQINEHPALPGSDDNGADSDRLLRLMNIVFGPVVTLFSSVVGFYFGARTAKEEGAT